MMNDDEFLAHLKHDVMTFYIQKSTSLWHKVQNKRWPLFNALIRNSTLHILWSLDRHGCQLQLDWLLEALKHEAAIQVCVWKAHKLCFGINMSVFCPVDRHSCHLPVAEGWDEGNPEGPEEDHGWPGPQLQGWHPEESPGEDQGGDRKQPQSSTAGDGDGDWSLSKGENRLNIFKEELITKTL